MRYSNLIAGLALATCSGIASAGLVIDSINVQMVSTKFSARNLKGTGDENFAKALNAFESSEGSVCNEDLDAFEGVSYSGTCGGGKRNYGALYTIAGSLTGAAEFQFGLDWGRGGFIVADSKDASVKYFNEDIWWAKNWNKKSEVKNYVLEDVGKFSLTLLGFEGCCDGINSAQYRTWDTNTVQTLQRSRLPEPSEWQTLEVNAVPVPGSLPLMAIGALLMWRRRQS
ncbi:PEP-CTERM sorting domain-containing protein [Congregibacter variabilis]|uniref:PEP-CTERM sorting domain-containing protein n=1 Tax=Congregibacter variabilis TaxID=3081200 RepID=A0ABZ0I0I6_9GAMM|nr:PEP-CTERM sorting domain-containing protein [Congregibacter sp. IMCC43200]